MLLREQLRRMLAMLHYPPQRRPHPVCLRPVCVEFSSSAQARLLGHLRLRDFQVLHMRHSVSQQKRSSLVNLNRQSQTPFSMWSSCSRTFATRRATYWSGSAISAWSSPGGECCGPLLTMRTASSGNACTPCCSTGFRLVVKV